MEQLFAVTLASMQADTARLDNIALNLANVQTAGYKRQVVSTAAFADALQLAQGGLTQVASDPRAGTLKTTGQPFDVALAGDGYFEVLTDSGPAYTRAGNFSVDATGRLVTAQGQIVMGRNGDIRLATRTPVIDAAGRITESAEPGGEARLVDHLKVVRFDKPQALRRLGDGLVAGADGMTLMAEGEPQVRQGALENANVNSTSEMVELIRTMRHFEGVHRALQGYDEMVGTAIRKLTEN
jgi:flagellar basal-body rod protein FlgF